MDRNDAVPGELSARRHNRTFKQPERTRGRRPGVAAQRRGMPLRKGAMPSPSIFEPADRRPLRILIVDDDEDTAYLSSTLLETKGHEVESALGGESALSRVESFAPDLVILDVVMP